MRSTVTAIQEVHGSEAAFRTAIPCSSTAFHTFTSFTDNPNEAGVVTMFKKMGSPQSSFRAEAVIEGRALRVECSSSSSDRATFVHWNIHNHDLGRADARRLAARLQADVVSAKSNPTGFVLVVSGDWNFLPPEEFRRSISNPNSTRTSAHRAANPGQLDHVFQPILNELVDIASDLDTRYDSGTNLLSRLDRTYVSIPTWLIMQLHLQSSVVQDALSLHDQKISDHAPVILSIAEKRRLSQDEKPIPRFVFDSPLYLESLTALVHAANLDALSVPLRLPKFKQLIREAARIARNETLSSNDSAAHPRSTIFSSIARCVWRNDLRMFDILSRRSLIASSFLVNDGGTIFINDPIKFDTDFNAARRDATQARIREIESDSMPQIEAPIGVHTPRQQDHKRSRSKIANLRRMLELWNPIGKRLSIVGIRVRPEEVTYESNLMLSALSSNWEPIFARKEIDSCVASSFASQFASKFDFSSSPPPSSRSFASFLRRVQHSAPGKDGIPYAAYAKSTDISSVIFYDISVWLRRGNFMLMEYNDTLKIFIPKGEEEQDDVQIIRSPEATRPLGLKNKDNTTIAAVTNNSIRFPVARDACSLQRGFLVGRNFVNNIVDLDTFARIFACDPNLFFPLLVFFDFGSAFASLVQSWLFITLKAIHFPDGAYNIISALYHQVAAFGRIAGSSSRFLFLILSGIIQGCPLAGTCFALAIDPFLSKFKQEIEDRGLGIIRACADDIGAALRSVTVLPKIAETFKNAEVLAGLTLNLKKTNFLPLNVPLSATATSHLKGWLSKHVPHWSDVQIVDCARYLGAFLGPKSAHVAWESPIAKWANRTSVIAASGAPVGVSVMLYNTRALSTLSYVAQFSFIPQSAFPRERALLGRLLHLPGNALTSAGVFSLVRWGSYEIKSAFATSLAILMRSALVTLTTWPSMIELLKRSDAEFFDTQQGAVRPHFKPNHWDSISIAELLQEAALGYPSSKWVGDAGKLAIAAFRRERSESKRFPKGIQTIFYKIFLDALYADSIPMLIKKRMRVLAPESALPDSFYLTALRDTVSKYPESIIFTLVRCWSNGWTTSVRMPEGLRRCCLLGCAGQPDDLHHYLRCERLWRATKTALKATLTSPPLMTNAQVLEKLAISSTSKRLVCNLCMVTHAYHTIKWSYRDKFSVATAAEIAKISIEVLKAAAIRFNGMFPNDRDERSPPFAGYDMLNAQRSTSCASSGSPPGRPPGEHPDASENLHVDWCRAEVAELAGREFCEPECSDFAAGLHHPCCSQAFLLREPGAQAMGD
jgi:hypothetical protein